MEDVPADNREVSAWERLMERVVDSLAPYKIFKDGDHWVVKNNAGMVKAKFNSRADALKYLRALYANVPGAAKKADRTKWTGKEPKPEAAMQTSAPQTNTSGSAPVGVGYPKEPDLSLLGEDHEPIPSQAAGLLSRPATAPGVGTSGSRYYPASTGDGPS